MPSRAVYHNSAFLFDPSYLPKTKANNVRDCTVNKNTNLLPCLVPRFCTAISLFVAAAEMAIMKRQNISSPNCGGRYFIALLFVALFGFLSANCVQARLATFSGAFRVTWGSDHLRQMEGGNTIQLKLDQASGSGFASMNKYLFGHVSMRIKLVPGDSAGTVTAFYMNSDTDTIRDELDFEFLGNRSGEPYTVQTNIYTHGKGNREQRINLWFDPSSAFHTYSILWNHYHVVFFVDDTPIRVFKNNEAQGILYPKSQPMGVYSTLWEADEWATRGGLDKIDWSKAPFYAYYTDFDIEGCAVPGSNLCASNPNNWWEGEAYRQLSHSETEKYIYDYCTDRSRYPVTPPECAANI